MSTRHDRNGYSWDNQGPGSDDPPTHDFVIDIVRDKQWFPGSWQDSGKVYKYKGEKFARITVVLGGTEDCIDISPECCDNEFDDYRVNGYGSYILTEKGGSCRNIHRRWVIENPGNIVDIEIGNWSSSNFDPSTGNVFDGWRREDGKPVTYCYRLGCSPKFVNMKAKHLWWRSIGITAYWWAKYIWHIGLGQPDN